jgi:hypothetical protein
MPVDQIATCVFGHDGEGRPLHRPPQPLLPAERTSSAEVHLGRQYRRWGAGRETQHSSRWNQI